MRVRLEGFRGLLVAASVGTATELALFLKAYLAAGDLAAHHPWLQISQMPGAQISYELFAGTNISAVLYRYIGIVPENVFAILMQAAIYTSVGLSAIYIFGLLHQRRARGL